MSVNALLHKFKYNRHKVMRELKNQKKVKKV